MENYLRENFEVEPKTNNEKALERWRSAVSLVKNHKRRFRFRIYPDSTKKDAEAERRKLKIQEKIRIALYVKKAALQFIDAGNQFENKVSDETTQAGYGIGPNELASIASGNDYNLLKIHGGVEGIAKNVKVSLDDGVSEAEVPIRKNIYGVNRFVDKHSIGFLMLAREALKDLLSIILLVCAMVSIVVGIATDGWLKGVYAGFGILFSFLVMVRAISNYMQSLQFWNRDKEKRKIAVQVTRDGYRQKVSIYDLVVGDVVYLSIGDQVPADGVFISGYSLLIDESNLSGESKPVNRDKKCPFLLSGAKVHDGSCKMLVTSVGMRTDWGRMMRTLSEGGGDESPLQENVQESTTSSTKSRILKAFKPPKVVSQAGYGIHPDKVASMVRNCDIISLNALKGRDEIARCFDVTYEKGVCPSKVEVRQRLFGYNRYIEKPSHYFLTFIQAALQEWNLIILMVVILLCEGLKTVSGSWIAVLYDGVLITMGNSLVVMLTTICDYRQYAELSDLHKGKKKLSVSVRRDGCKKEVSIDDVVVGDIVYIINGDVIPADGLMISSKSLVIDMSSLSGLSEFITVDEVRPFLLSGCKVQNGSGEMMVASVGMKTARGVLMQMNDITPMQAKLRDFSRTAMEFKFTITIAVALLILNILVEHLLSLDATKALKRFGTATILIGFAILRKLRLMQRLNIAVALRKLINGKAISRCPLAFEAISSFICIFLETSAVTTNSLVVEKIWTNQEAHLVRVDSSWDELKSILSEGELSILLQCIFQNTTSSVRGRKDGKKDILGGTPIEAALLEFGLSLGGEFDSISQCSQIVKVAPFDSLRMSMLVSLPSGGYRAFCTGAPKTVIGMCDKIMTRIGNSGVLSEVHNLKEVLDGFAGEYQTPLCLAFKDLDGTSNIDSIPDSSYTLIAVIGIKNPLRSGVKEAVQKLLDAGIDVKLVTGDDIDSAKVIAKQCGISTDDRLTIEASDFLCKSPREMKVLRQKIQVVARSSCLDKNSMMNQLWGPGEVAAFDDCTDDVFSVHESNSGLAMHITGKKVAKGNADIVIVNDHFSTILNIFRWGHAVHVNNQNFMQLELTVVVACLVISLAYACILGLLVPEGSFPFQVIQLLWFNMIVDIPGSLALVTEPCDDRLMYTFTIGRGIKFITRYIWRCTISCLLLGLGVLALRSKWLMKISGSDADVLYTITFILLGFFQVFIQITCCKREMESIFLLILDRLVFLLPIVYDMAFRLIVAKHLGAFPSS